MRRITALAALALVGVFAPAIAGNLDPTDRTTAWVKPTGAVRQSDCVWGYAIQYSSVDDRTSDPADTCLQATSDAYAHTIADGMQIQGYSWARDECGAAATAGIWSGSSGVVSVFIKASSMGCPFKIVGDWRPRVRLRVHQSDPPGACEAGAQMRGEIVALDILVELQHALIATSDGKTVASLAAGIPGIVGAEALPITWFVSSAPAEMTLEDIVHREKSVLSAVATYRGHVWTQALAKTTAQDPRGESEAWVWDSRPGLDLHGECGPPCDGHAYVVYGWEMPR